MSSGNDVYKQPFETYEFVNRKNKLRFIKKIGRKYFGETCSYAKVKLSKQEVAALLISGQIKEI